MSLRIGINFQKKIELILMHLDRTVKITTLKNTIEYPLPFSEVGIHALKSSIEQSWLIEAISS